MSFAEEQISCAYASSGVAGHIMQGKVLHIDGEEECGRYFDWSCLGLETKRGVLEKEKKAL